MSRIIVRFFLNFLQKCSFFLVFWLVEPDNFSPGSLFLNDRYTDQSPAPPAVFFWKTGLSLPRVESQHRHFQNKENPLSHLFRAQIKLKEDEEGRKAFLKANGKYTLDTIAKGSLKDAKDTEFIAVNDRFDFKLNPAAQDTNEGSGTIAFNDKVR